MHVPNVPFEHRVISQLISRIETGWKNKSIFLTTVEHDTQITEPLQMKDGWSSIFDIALRKIKRENVCYKVDGANETFIAPCDVEKILKRLACARNKLGVRNEDSEKILV